MNLYGDIKRTLVANPELMHKIASAEPKPTAIPAPARSVLRCYRDIEPQPLRWLWHGRIPLGKLTLLMGDAGLGKSLITVDITSHTTRGTAFPDGTKPEPGNVILLNAEDDAADTIRPRLEAAGADISRVHNLDAVRITLTDGSIAEKPFSLETDCANLEDAFRHNPDVRLVVIDPVSAYLGSVNSNSNAEVRGVLAPLAALAGKCNVAMLLVSHPSKAAGAALYRVSASIAFAAAPRAVWGVGSDPEVDGRKLMVPVKQNLAPNIGGLAYRVEAPDGVPILAWERDPVWVKADDILGSWDAQDRNETNEAKDWLRELLADGPVETNTIQKKARAAGLSWITVRRAKDALGAVPNKAGYQGAWGWKLKDAHPYYSPMSTFEQGTENKPVISGKRPIFDKGMNTFEQVIENTPVNGGFHSKDAHLGEMSAFDDENSSGRAAHPCSHCGGSGKAQSSCPRCTSLKHCCVCGGIGLSARTQ